MTAQREWPNAAKEARDRAAEELVAVLHELKPILDERTPEDPRLPVARAYIHSQVALRFLESVDAQTRPT
jgi:hypothetical protein